jgi:hypothetical protein
MRRSFTPTRTAAAVLACVASLLVLPVAPAGAAPSSIQVLATFMTGAAEVPGPGDNNGFGAFAAVTTEHKLCYVVTAKKIEPATVAHIHAGDETVAGPVVVALRAPSRGLAADCIRTVPEEENSGDTLTDAELAAIRANPDQFYVNVHNDPFPAGAIRGQLH